MSNEENNFHQTSLELGEHTVELIEINEKAYPASQRPVRKGPYPCEDPAKKTNCTDHLRPKQELSYYYNDIIRAVNRERVNGRQIPEYNGHKPLEYCKELISLGINQESLFDVGPMSRDKKLEIYFNKQPNLEISLRNFLLWLEMEDNFIDSVTVPPFNLKSENGYIRVTRSTCDAIQLNPKKVDLFSKGPNDEFTHRVYNAQISNINAKDLINDFKSIADFYVLEFKIGHPDVYSNTSLNNHREQIKQYINRIHMLTEQRVTGKLIYFSDRVGQPIIQEIYEVEDGFWDTLKTVKI
jgi:hypothetical protein